MPKSELNLFEQLRRGSPISERSRPVEKIYFKSRFVGRDFYLSVVNAEGKPVEVDYTDYSGAERRLLKIIEQLYDQFSFAEDTESDEPAVNLTENEFILWQLKDITTLVDSEMVPIEFNTEMNWLALDITESAQLECRLSLCHSKGEEKKFKLISESFCLANNQIYTIRPIGENFALLPSFEAAILPSDLDKYLTLLFSYFDHIDARYRDFKVVKGPEISAIPSLMIDKITPDGSLYIKTAYSLPFFDSEFLSQYDVSRVARVNSDKAEIAVSPLVMKDTLTKNAALEKVIANRKREEDNDEVEAYQEGNLYILSPSLAEAFLLKDLPKLATSYVVFGSEKLSTYNVKVVKPDIKLSLDHGIDFLEGDVELQIENETFSLFDALYLYRQNSYIQLNDGTRALINQEYINRLERIFQKHREKVKVSFYDLPLIDDLIIEKASNDVVLAQRSVFEGFGMLDQFDFPEPEINTDCRDYQIEGYRWLKYLQSHHLGGCLADDMGLGKTVQAIALLSSIYPKESKPSLIVIPKSLIFNWRQEFSRFCPALSVSVYYGADRDLDAASKSNIVITTYGMVRNDIKALKDRLFYYVILDESQNIKSVNSQVSKAVSILHSEHRLALSGTPIENNLSELYSLFRFLSPGMFGSLERFNRQYLAPIQQQKDEAVTRELKRKIFPFVLRRQKKDVLKELPDKIEQVLLVEMNPDHKKLYEQRRRFFYESTKDQISNEGLEKSRFFVLQALTDLRQAASIPEVKSDGLIISPKRQLLREMITEATANEHKILMFANFLSILDAVADDLQKEKIGFEMMTGATRNREEVVRRFQENSSQSVFLMTLKTGGIGLNLTAADIVFIFDPWWNLAAENQAVDRSHRIGQSRTVFSYKLVTVGTIEEKILKLQQQKKNLADEIISDDRSAVKLLNEEDIEYILGDRF